MERIALAGVLIINSGVPVDIPSHDDDGVALECSTALAYQKL